MDDRDITAIQAMLDPLLPGLLGVRLVSVEPDHVVADGHLWEVAFNPGFASLG